jgi:hypothetical protein
MTAKTLHTLNAVRVLAEYVVVHHHLSFLFPSVGGLFAHSTMSDNLMSFFFVLSGFVAMHSNMDVDFSHADDVYHYIKKRFRKTYLTYLIMYFADLPGTIVTGNHACGLFWISLASQPLLLHCWIGSHHIAISNGVGWYLCTLYWLWVAFPFLRLKQMMSSYPWTKIFMLYCCSVSLWILLAPYNIVYTRAVPIFRVFEFIMGSTVAFTLEKRIHGFMVIVCLAGFFAYCVFDFRYPELLQSEPLYGNCTLWIQKHNKAITPTVVLSKFSIVWALLIHWLACAELAGSGVAVRILQYDLFKNLSAFSLHLYLGHYTIALGVKTAFTAIGYFSLWDHNIMIIFCYIIAYAFSVYVQPLVDTVWTCIFKKRNEASVSPSVDQS